MRITTRAIIFNTKNQLLTVHHKGSDFWALPGGKIETNEDLQTCLQREIFEELGVSSTIHNLACVHEFQWSPESDITTEFFFYVTITEEKIENFSGKYFQQELKKISWNTLDETLNIKPEFLKTQAVQTLKNTTQYISYML